MGEENPKALNKELLDSLTTLATNLSAAIIELPANHGFTARLRMGVASASFRAGALYEPEASR